MKRAQAVEAARSWVREEAYALPGFCGAYLSGSILEAADGDIWPESSDVDVVLVLRDPNEIPAFGKFRYGEALLEITLLERSAFHSLEHVLRTHYLAFALNAGVILSDPEGWLVPLHRQTASAYARPEWVRARCRGFLAGIRRSAEEFDATVPYPARVNSWLFPTGISTFPILAAALCNCTVRRRYARAREALQQYGLGDFYPALLRQLVGDGFDPACLPGHLDALAETFDLACETSGPSDAYRFRSDIRPQARPIAIDGCRQMLSSEHPQDAIFWMGVTFARCQTVLALDDPALSARRLSAFRAFMADIGIAQDGDFVRRFAQLEAFLPQIERIAERIMRTRPECAV